MDILDLDAATIRAIIELRLEDINAIDESDSSSLDVSDSEIALKTQRSELEALLRFESDRVFSQSLAVDDESQNRRDTTLPNSNDSDNDTNLYDNSSTSNISQENPDGDFDAADGADISSCADTSEMSQAEEEYIATCNCVSCRDAHPIHNVVESGCSDSYCQTCLIELFERALVDETFFPPRCCGQPIPIDSASELLSSDLISRFHEKDLEFNTKDRTYCHINTCSAFIPPNVSIVGDEATCPKCESKTCATCKAAFHEGEDCPENPATQELIRMAEEEGWQRCFLCRRLVELSTGCNHITCPCGAEFCYHCGERWKTCDCPQWHEERLLARARAIVDRDVAREPAPVAPVERERRVRAEAQNQRQNHDCTTHIWRFRHGADSCDFCNENLPTFIMACEVCNISACRRCSLNRARTPRS